MASRTSASTCFCLILSVALAGCSSAGKKDDDAAQLETRQLVQALSTRVESLESKLVSMNDKLESTRNTVDNVTNTQKPKTSGVSPHPAVNGGTNVEIPASPHDPEAGFVNDSAVQAFRQAKILFDTKKFPEAVLAFSAFLQSFADHALAGTAQYYVGESYYQQGEHKLALQEYKRVLTSYDRSPAVPETLRRLAATEDHLKETEAAAKHRQLLSSLFPQSPAAAKTETGTVTNSGSAPAETKSEPSQPVSAPAAPAAGLDEPPPTAPVKAPQGGEKTETQEVE